MNYSDRLAFIPLRYLMPLLWLIIIIDTSVFSYLYIKNDLQVSVKEDISEHIKERFLYANRNLNNALNIGLNRDELRQTQNVFEFENRTSTIMGYVSKEGKVELLSGHEKEKGLEYFLKKDFKEAKEFLRQVSIKLAQLGEDEYTVWANKDVFYIFRPLFGSGEEKIHFLRYSIKDKRSEYIADMLQIVVLYTVVLIGMMLLMGVFSYFIIQQRLTRLIRLISGYRSNMQKEDAIEGNDEISAISKAFCQMSHRLNAVLDGMYTFVIVLNQKGRIIFVNNTPLRIFNISFKEAEGKMFSEMHWWKYDTKVQGKIEMLLGRCMKGEIIDEEIQIQIADTRLTWIRLGIHPVYDIKGKIEQLVAQGIDISAQKEAHNKALPQRLEA